MFQGAEIYNFSDELLEQMDMAERNAEVENASFRPESAIAATDVGPEDEHALSDKEDETLEVSDVDSYESSGDEKDNAETDINICEIDDAKICGQILRIIGDDHMCRACGRHLRNIGDDLNYISVLRQNVNTLGYWMS